VELIFGGWVTLRLGPLDLFNWVRGFWNWFPRVWLGIIYLGCGTRFPFKTPGALALGSFFLGCAKEFHLNPGFGLGITLSWVVCSKKEFKPEGFGPWEFIFHWQTVLHFLRDFHLKGFPKEKALKGEIGVW